MTTKKAVGVDSGRLLVCDPCYVLDVVDYQRLLDSQREDGSFDTSFLTPNAGRDICAVVNTSGDGLFLVEAQEGPDGYVRVDFS